MQTPNFDPRDPSLYNAWINSNFDLWQRQLTITRTNLAATSGFCADRILAGVSGGVSKSITISRSTQVPPSLLHPADYSYEVLNNTAVASYPAGENIEPFLSKIEGTMFRPLIGKNFTIGFWFFSSYTGKVPIAVRTSTHSFVSVKDCVVGWQYLVVHVPHHASISSVGITSAIEVDVALAGGTAYNASSLDTWIAGAFYSHSTATNWTANAGAIIRFSQMQLRLGYLSADEMKNSYRLTGLTTPGEVALCQRYFEKSYDLEVPAGTATIVGWHTFSGNGASNRPYSQIYFKQMKRAAPGAVFYNPRTGGTGSPVWDFNTPTTDYTIAGLGTATHSMSIAPGGTPPISSALGVQWVADSEL